MTRTSKIFIYSSIAISAIWAIFLALGVFGALDVKSIAGAHFNYIAALIIDIVGILFYVGFVFVEKIRNLTIPEWFKVLFYIAFLVFTNVYYLFSWYHTIAGLIVFAVYIAVLFNILAVSLFYNTQKDAKNVVKTTDRFLVFSCFAYAGLMTLVYQLISVLVKLLSNSTDVIASLAMIVSEMSVMLFVGFVFALLFAISLKRTRRLVNACLIKHVVINEYRTKK